MEGAMCAGRDMCRGQCVLVGICGGGNVCW